MNIHLLLFRLLRPARGFLAVANDAFVPVVNSTGEAAIFEVAQDGSFFIPYGEYPHKKGLQIFNRQAAEEMRSFANSIAGRVVGMPLYIGHPDVPGRPDTNPAAPAVGWFTDIVVENDGARFVNKLGPRGEQAVANAEFRFYSPNWICRKLPGGKLAPARLKSMGLTNNPNIPVPAIANDDNHQTQDPETMNPTLLALLGLDAAANDGAGPTAAEIEAAVVALGGRLQTLENDAAALVEVRGQLTTAQADVTRLTGELQTANDRASTLEGQVTTANDAATAARALLIDRTLASCIATGRLTEAQRETQRQTLVALENDTQLTEALTALESAKPTLKTASAIRSGAMDGARANLAAENDASARAERRRQAVDEELQAIANDMAPKQRHDLAWERAARKHPDLFSSQPASAA